VDPEPVTLSSTPAHLSPANEHPPGLFFTNCGWGERGYGAGRPGAGNNRPTDAARAPLAPATRAGEVTLIVAGVFRLVWITTEGDLNG
jgi:hypothetical protein